MHWCWGADERRARARRGAVWCGATGEGGDGRKNDGHKYRSYLCFMTVRPRYRQEESARIRGKAPTIDSQILTDVLAQWIPVSPVEPPPLSLFFSLFLPSRGRRTRFRSLPHGKRCNIEFESAAVTNADPNLRYLLYELKEKHVVRILTLWSSLYYRVLKLPCKPHVTVFLAKQNNTSSSD